MTRYTKSNRPGWRRSQCFLLARIWYSQSDSNRRFQLEKMATQVTSRWEYKILQQDRIRTRVLTLKGWRPNQLDDGNIIGLDGRIRTCDLRARPSDLTDNTPSYVIGRWSEIRTHGIPAPNGVTCPLAYPPIKLAPKAGIEPTVAFRLYGIRKPRFLPNRDLNAICSVSWIRTNLFLINSQTRLTQTGITEHITLQ